MNENEVELAALGWLAGLGYEILQGPEIAPDQPGAERADYSQVILEARLNTALERLNPSVPPDAIEEAFRKLTRPDMPSLVASNQVVHKYLAEGVPVENQRPDGSIGGVLVRLLDSFCGELLDWLMEAEKASTTQNTPTAKTKKSLNTWF